MHNKGRYASEFLRVNRANARDAELILIDDGSADETGAIMKRHADVFMRTEDVWEVKANNVGLRASSGDYVGIVQDDDLMLADRWMTTSAAFMAQHDIDILGGRGTGLAFFPTADARAGEHRLDSMLTFETTDDELEDLDVRRRRLDFRRKPALLTYRRQPVYRTDVVVRSPIIVSRRAIEQIGYLDERYAPLTYDDHAYCMAAKRQGMKVAVTRIPQIGRFGNGSHWLYDQNRAKRAFFLECETRNSRLFIEENRETCFASTYALADRRVGTIGFRMGLANVLFLARYLLKSPRA